MERNVKKVGESRISRSHLIESPYEWHFYNLHCKQSFSPHFFNGLPQSFHSMIPVMFSSPINCDDFQVRKRVGGSTQTIYYCTYFNPSRTNKVKDDQRHRFMRQGGELQPPIQAEMLLFSGTMYPILGWKCLKFWAIVPGCSPSPQHKVVLYTYSHRAHTVQYFSICAIHVNSILRGSKFAYVKPLSPYSWEC